MNQTEHTPGPWSVHPGLTTRGRIGTYGIMGENDGCHVDIADVNVFKDYEAEGEANARLIAAAPDLLEALESLRAEVVGLGYSASLSAADARAHAAIRKARGEGEA